METRSEKELIGRAKAGDRRAFDELVKENREKMFALIYRMTGDRETALDLLQETFFTAFKKLDRFRGESAFSSWLYRIASNKSLNHIRRRNLVGFVPFVGTDENEPGIEMRDNIEAEETTSAASKAIAELPPKQRAAFNLRFYEELPFSEIARILNRSESAVKTNYQKALEKLREKLKDFR